jgi:hypothetical protein
VKTQIGWQIGAYDSLDVKTGIVLAFDGVIGALIFTLHLHPRWAETLPFASVLASAVFGVIALWPREPYIGPSAAAFYDKHANLGDDELEAQLLANLSAASLANIEMIRLKSRHWMWASALLVLALLLVGALSLAYSNG